MKALKFIACFFGWFFLIITLGLMLAAPFLPQLAIVVSKILF